jgi:hypothetical protein
LLKPREIVIRMGVISFYRYMLSINVCSSLLMV